MGGGAQRRGALYRWRTAAPDERAQWLEKIFTATHTPEIIERRREQTRQRWVEGWRGQHRRLTPNTTPDDTSSHEE